MPVKIAVSPETVLRWLHGSENKKKSATVPANADAIIAECLTYKVMTAHFGNGKTTYTRGIG